jgi:hypothetical protein
MEKPSVVYHGSPRKIDGPLQPILLESELVDESHDRPAVFATEDVATASLFMMPNDALFSIGREQGISYVCIWGTPEEFTEKDRGGYVYVLPIDTFVRRGKEYEWQSDVAVLPTEVRHYDSVLEGMRENDVRIYFINDDELFDRIQADKNRRLEILKDMKPWGSDLPV